MSRPSDETLMAYADGALSVAERERVEQHLAIDPEARRIVAMFRATRELAAEAFAPLPETAASRSLADAILNHPLPDAGGSKVISLAPAGTARQRQAPDFRVHRSLLPLAASLVLAFGVGLGWLLGRAPTAATTTLALGPVAAGSVLGEVLELRRSGQPLHDHLVVATFRDRNGRVCREVERLTAGPGSQAQEAGVACRSSDGRWTVEGAARISVAGARPVGSFEPSGADEKDALSSLLTLLGASAALPADEEGSLLARGWR